MNATLVTIIALRAGALAATIAGQVKTGAALYAAADLVESGRATDEHMALVAEKLKSRDLTSDDWDELADRLEAESARLQSDAPAAPSVG